jgi:hypothetical protein
MSPVPTINGSISLPLFFLYIGLVASGGSGIILQLIRGVFSPLWFSLRYLFNFPYMYEYTAAKSAVGRWMILPVTWSLKLKKYYHTHHIQREFFCKRFMYIIDSVVTYSIIIDIIS